MINHDVKVTGSGTETSATQAQVTAMLAMADGHMA